MQSLDKIGLAIPAYNPPPSLIKLVDNLCRQGFQYIVIINDGSDRNTSHIFREIEKIPNVIMLNHEKNLGKGAALKTGFRYFVENLSVNINRVVTMDADGQHSVEDVRKIAISTQNHRNCLILGARNFSGPIPFRSKLGNRITKFIMKLFTNLDLEDTQTGLRGIPIKMLKPLLKISANRYEFELECLLKAKQLGFRIIQIPITTIYINKNISSHFRPVIDSMRIYFVFIRFVYISIVSFLIDITSFSLLYGIFSDIVISTYTARILSGSVNFYFNKYTVFRSHGTDTLIKESLSYALLAIFIATMSAILVQTMSIINAWYPTINKIIADLSLFIISFLVQKIIIFRIR